MIYDLKTYTATNGNYAALLTRFSEKTLPIFHRLGINVIHCWESKVVPNTFYYLTEYDDAIAYKASWDAFANDSEWVQIKGESEKLAGGPLLASQSSVTFHSLPFSPARR